MTYYASQFVSGTTNDDLVIGNGLDAPIKYSLRVYLLKSGISFRRGERRTLIFRDLRSFRLLKMGLVGLDACVPSV